MGELLYREDNWSIGKVNQDHYSFYLDAEQVDVVVSADTMEHLYEKIPEALSKIAKDLVKTEEEFRLKAPGFFREAVKDPARRDVVESLYAFTLEGRDTESVFGRQGCIALSCPPWEKEYAFFELPSDLDCSVCTVEQKVKRAIQELTDKLHIHRIILDSVYKAFNRFLKNPDAQMKAFRHKLFVETLPTVLLDIRDNKTVTLFDKSQAMVNICQEFIDNMKEYGIVPEDRNAGNSN